MGLAAAAPLLLERLRNGEPPEQAAAAQGLARLSPDALGELDGCLEQGAAEPVVVEALGVLARTPVPALDPRVLALAESRSAGVRLAALRAASRIPGSRAEVALLRALADRHVPIQAEALDLLVRRGGEKSVTTLVGHAGNGGLAALPRDPRAGPLPGPGGGGAAAGSLPPVRSPRAAADRLVAAPDRAGVAPEFLLLRLESPDLDMRRAAAQGLAESCGPR